MRRRELIAAACAASWLRGAENKREIRLISVAPSPYTQRRDSFRAGAGIFLCLQRLVKEHSLPLEISYWDAAPWLKERERLKGLVRGASVLLVGTSVWAQGPASVGREFFEAVNTEELSGVQASTWVCSGGAHTGAAMAHDSNLATLRGMGAAVFSFGQKQAVFSTDERIGEEKAGEFTLLDCFFMEGLAKAAIVAALAAGDRAKATELWTKLQSSPNYYLKHFPKSAEELRGRFGEIRQLINEARLPRSESRRKVNALLSNPPA